MESVTITIRILFIKANFSNFFLHVCFHFTSYIKMKIKILNSVGMGSRCQSRKILSLSPPMDTANLQLHIEQFSNTMFQNLRCSKSNSKM